MALDGLGTNSTCQAVSCDAQLLTTTQGHDVIVLVVMCICQYITPYVLDSNGLTFNKRITYTPPPPIGGVGLWEFYARTTSPLASDNITVLYSTSPGLNFSTSPGLSGIQVLAIRGANARAIFDPNPSIPGMVSCPSVACGDCHAYNESTTCSASIQTSTLDFVIAGTAIGDAGPCGGYPNYPSLGGGVRGFTTITTNKGYGGWFEVDYTTTTVPQTTVVFDCNGTDAAAIAMDAISISPAPA